MSHRGHSFKTIDEASSLQLHQIIMAQDYYITCGDHKFHVYDYDNCKFAAQIYYHEMDRFKMVEHIGTINKMDIRNDDVLILTYPKSGTHLLREIVHMLQVGRIEYIGADVLDFPIEYRDPDEVAQMKSPRTMHSHMPFRMLPEQIRVGRKGKVIALFRNPKDVVVSYWHFLQKTEKIHFPLEDLVNLFIKGDVYHNSWYEWRKGLVEGREKHGDFPLLVLTYEDCIQDLKSVITNLAKYLEKDVTDQFIDEIVNACDIKKMRKGKMENQPKDVTILTEEGYQIYYRKGVVGDWKNTLTESLNSALDKWISSQEEDGCNEFPNYIRFYNQ